VTAQDLEEEEEEEENQLSDLLFGDDIIDME